MFFYSDELFLKVLYYLQQPHTPSPGGYYQKNWVGVGGPLPKTLTLFMTKLCETPYAFYDLTKNSKPYCWFSVSRNSK